MRTTLDIDDEVLMVAKELAQRERKTTGQVVSQLLRQAMTGATAQRGFAAREPDACYGFRPFISRGGMVGNEIVDRLRDEEGI